MLRDHSATIDLYKTLVDIRFKLLTFVPTATTIAVGVISRNNPSGLNEPGGRLLVGIGGLVASLAIVIYEVRNSQIHDRAIHRIRHLEKLLGLTPSYPGSFPRGMFSERGGRGRMFRHLNIKHDQAISMIYGIVLALWTWTALSGVGAYVNWLGSQATGSGAVLRAIAAALVGLAVAAEITRQGGMGREPALIYTLGDIVPGVVSGEATAFGGNRGTAIWRDLDDIKKHAKCSDSVHDLLHSVVPPNADEKESASTKKLVDLAIAGGMVVDHQRLRPPWYPRKGREYALRVAGGDPLSPREALAQAIVGGQEVHEVLRTWHQILGTDGFIPRGLVVLGRDRLSRRYGADAPWCSYHEAQLRFELLAASPNASQNSENNLDPSTHEYDRELHDHLELWKHYAAFGGEDKSRMVTIASLILGFSVAILGVVATLPVTDESWYAFQEPERAITYSLIGLVASGIAAYVVVLYAGYSNQNWRKADRIAKGLSWENLTTRIELNPKLTKQPLILLSERFARSCDPNEEFAPVFTTFLVLSLLLMLAHGLIIMVAGSILLR